MFHILHSTYIQYRTSEEAAVIEWGHSAIISALDGAVAAFGPQTSQGVSFVHILCSYLMFISFWQCDWVSQYICMRLQSPPADSTELLLSNIILLGPKGSNLVMLTSIFGFCTKFSCRRLQNVVLHYKSFCTMSESYQWLLLLLWESTSFNYTLILTPSLYIANTSVHIYVLILWYW